jgi:cytochrome c oxidase cbb3-type subunit III
MSNPQEDPLRPHTYDGIQEYDKRLPNWWLASLWGTVIFSLIYWIYYHELDLGKEPAVAVMEEIAAAKSEAAKHGGVVNDEMLWKLSQDAATVAAGKEIFMDPTRCVVCHLPTLQGMIGPNLVDKEWIHGGTPMEVMNIINEGVPAKGMVPWKTQLTQEQIKQVVAFIMSHHKQGEEIVKVAGWVIPGAPPAPAPK